MTHFGSNKPLNPPDLMEILLPLTPVRAIMESFLPPHTMACMPNAVQYGRWLPLSPPRRRETLATRTPTGTRTKRTARTTRQAEYNTYDAHTYTLDTHAFIHTVHTYAHACVPTTHMHIFTYFEVYKYARIHTFSHFSWVQYSSVASFLLYFCFIFLKARYRVWFVTAGKKI